MVNKTAVVGFPSQTTWGNCEFTWPFGFTVIVYVVGVPLQDSGKPTDNLVPTGSQDAGDITY